MAEKIMSGRAVVGSAVQAGVGGAAYFIAAKAGPKVQFFQSRWWALPSAMILTGHVLKKWAPESGAAVAGAGGAMLAMSYYVQSSQTSAQPAAPAAGFFQGHAGAIMRGAGAYGQLGPGEAGAYPENATSRYRRSEAGALIT